MSFYKNTSWGFFIISPFSNLFSYQFDVQEKSRYSLCKTNSKKKGEKRLPFNLWSIRIFGLFNFGISLRPIETRKVQTWCWKLSDKRNGVRRGGWWFDKSWKAHVLLVLPGIFVIGSSGYRNAVGIRWWFSVECEMTVNLAKTSW